MARAEFGGMPAWLLEAYLVELGGTSAGSPHGPTVVVGDGWRAMIVPQPSAGAAMRIARVVVTIEGAGAPDVMAALRKKAQRGGG